MPGTPKEAEAAKRGRPELPEEQRRGKMIRVRVTDEEAAKFERLGGAKWLREVLKKAREWAKK